MRRVLFSLLIATMVVTLADAALRPDAEVGITQVPSAVVVGFVGGFIRHDNLAHGGVQLAARLRKDYPPAVYIGVFENRHGQAAYNDILHQLDTNHDGRLSDEEKLQARIVIYGHSWGGSETVALARALQRDQIPVLLTIQVDSVAKIGEEDTTIPSNVAEAVNYYQSDGFLRGCSQIHAEVSSRTRILGNYRFEYRAHPIQCSGLPWYSHLFTRPHIEIECDPAVLDRIEFLIRSKLPKYPSQSGVGN
jgi:hypothetical protein